MALDTYNNLLTQAIEWSHRDDLGPKMPDFIQLAENFMYSNDVEVLTVRSMETVSTALTAGEYLALPDNFESARSVSLITGSNICKLVYKAPQQMMNEVSPGMPSYFTVVGNELQFDRVPDSEYTIQIQYYRKALPLTAANQTNEILTDHPNIYLFGTLAIIFGYAQDTEQEISYINKFIASVRGANKADKKGRYGPAPAMSLTCGMTP